MRGLDPSGTIIRAYVWWRCSGEHGHVTPATEVAPAWPVSKP